MLKTYLASNSRAKHLPLIFPKTENEDPRQPLNKRNSATNLSKTRGILPLTPAQSRPRVLAGNDSTFRKTTVSPDGLHPRYLKEQAQVIDKIKKIDLLISYKSPTSILSKMKIEDAKMKNEQSEFYRVTPTESRPVKTNFRLSRYLNLNSQH